MKLPRTFRPDKNLEDKTNQLLEDPKVYIQPEPAVDGKYLDDLFDYLNESFFMIPTVHEKVDRIIGKSDYQVVPRSSKSNMDYSHWYRQDPLAPDSFYVLSRNDAGPAKRSFAFSPFKMEGYYSFARPTKDNLENFCKMFEKYSNWDSYRYNDYGWNRWHIKGRIFFGMMGAGMLIGAGASLAFVGWTMTMAYAAMMGMQLSLISNIFLEKHVFNLYKKIDTKRFNNYELKIRKIADDIITDDEAALRRAFS